MRQNERILEMQDRGSMTDGFESTMNVGAKCARLNDGMKVKWESSLLLVHRVDVAILMRIGVQGERAASKSSVRRMRVDRRCTDVGEPSALQPVLICRRPTVVGVARHPETLWRHRHSMVGGRMRFMQGSRRRRVIGSSIKTRIREGQSHSGGERGLRKRRRRVGWTGMMGVHPGGSRVVMTMVVVTWAA